MRILPQSASGAWLLAAVAWIGLCALVWMLTPVVPSGAARLPGVSFSYEVIGFGPGCATAIVKRPGNPLDQGAWHELLAVETATGHTTVLADRVHNIDMLDRSKAGEIWLLLVTNGNESQFLVVDLPSLQSNSIALTTDDLRYWGQSKLSPDGRLAAFCRLAEPVDANGNPTSGLLLWNLPGGKEHAFIPSLEPPYAFSGNGQRLAARIPGVEADQLAIVDLKTLAVRKIETSGHGLPFENAVLSGDGSYFAQLMLDSPTPFEIQSVDLVCWNVDTGREVVRDRIAPIQINPHFGTLAFGGNARVLFNLNGLITPDAIRCYDLASGAQRCGPWPENQGWDISPDGRWLVTGYDRRSGIWPRLKNALGLKWNLGGTDESHSQFFDAASGGFCGVLPGKQLDLEQQNCGDGTAMDVGWAPDGRTIAAQDRTDPSLWHIWDIPPRKPLAWFALTAGVLALPIAWLARRRVRRLRKEAA